MLTATLRRAALWPAAQIARRDFESQSFKRYNERPIEFGFVFRALGTYAPKEVLDVGTGTTALPHLMRNCGPMVWATDNATDYWKDGLVNPHYHVIDDDIRKTEIDRTFDMVTCVSTLEHIVPATSAVKTMLSLVKAGGHLVLTCPYTEDRYIKNVYEEQGSSRGQANAYTTQSFCRDNLREWFSGVADIVEQDYWRYWSGDFWTDGSQLIPPERSGPDMPHQLTCLVLTRR